MKSASRRRGSDVETAIVVRAESFTIDHLKRHQIPSSRAIKRLRADLEKLAPGARYVRSIERAIAVHIFQILVTLPEKTTRARLLKTYARANTLLRSAPAWMLAYKALTLTSALVARGEFHDAERILKDDVERRCALMRAQQPEIDWPRIAATAEDWRRRIRELRAAPTG